MSLWAGIDGKSSDGSTFTVITCNGVSENMSLRKKCLYSEFSGPNAGKDTPEILRIPTPFAQCVLPIIFLTKHDVTILNMIFRLKIIFQMSQPW